MKFSPDDGPKDASSALVTNLMLATTFVIVLTLAGGALGAWVGWEIGGRSPDFVASLAFGSPDRATPQFQAERFGLGVGAASGLFFGAGSGLLLVIVLALRDVGVARARARAEFIRRSSASVARA